MTNDECQMTNGGAVAASGKCDARRMRVRRGRFDIRHSTFDIPGIRYGVHAYV